MGLLITLILGLFIIIGAIITFVSKNNNKFVNFSISLAFSVMIMLMIVDLIPEVKEIFLEEFGNFKGILFALIGVILGIVLLKILDRFIPEHDGHEKEELNHIGLISSIALVLHNIIEGMAVYAAVNNSLESGLLMCLGIGLHNIPLGMVITSTFYKANNNKLNTWLIISSVSLSTFMGGLVMFLLSGVLVNELILGILLSITLGMLIYISFFELLPKIKEMKDKKIACLGLLTGIALILITIFI
ncbi:MAG: ZIP family metal transporter [Bacilli bacterium]|nr:ZIP family metal transporter [Bacilli bacterium]